MKKFAIAFGIAVVVNILISSLILHTVFSLTEPVVDYRVITSDAYDRSGVLYVNEHEWASSGRYRERGWVNIDAGTAVRIAQMLALGGNDGVASMYRLGQPYLVFHDEENDAFIVIADLVNGDGVVRVIVCSRTGGLLLTTILMRAWMPAYLPAHVIE
ncbi:MAG: hypothetical protein FWC70_03905 [Defluviitaleaceae bacterium]|nr:hypothetical protein [Defluviitaleaceae bacterium]